MQFTITIICVSTHFQRIVFLLRKGRRIGHGSAKENSFHDEKSPHLGRQLRAMSAIRTKFDEFCLIDPRTKTKFRQPRGIGGGGRSFRTLSSIWPPPPRLIVPRELYRQNWILWLRRESMASLLKRHLTQRM